MYYYHLNLIEYLIVKLVASVFSWEAITAITAIIVGIVAYYIADKQLDLVNFSEISLQAKKDTGYNWEFQLRNGSNHAIYITKIDPVTEVYKQEYNLSISSKGSGKLSLPPKDSGYYTLPVPPESKLDDYRNKEKTNCEIHIIIYFEDKLGKYKSHHVAWFQPPNANPESGTWSIQNLAAEKLN